MMIALQFMKFFGDCKDFDMDLWESKYYCRVPVTC